MSSDDKNISRVADNPNVTSEGRENAEKRLQSIDDSYGTSHAHDVASNGGSRGTNTTHASNEAKGRSRRAADASDYDLGEEEEGPDPVRQAAGYKAPTNNPNVSKAGKKHVPRPEGTGANVNHQCLVIRKDQP